MTTKHITKKTIASTLLLTSLLTLPATVSAYETGDIIVRAGVTTVSPNDHSSNISINGSEVNGTGASVLSDTQLGVTATYMLSPNWGASLLVSTPFKHDIQGQNIGINDLGSVKHLPPTLTLDYFPLKSESKIQPYIGLGVNYTIFFSERTRSEFNNALGESKLNLDDSVGLGIKAGLDCQVTDKAYLNATVYYLDIDTDATITTPSATITTDVDIDPYVYMVSVGMKF